MTIEVALLVSVVSVSFAIFFGLKSNKRADIKDIEERVKENTRINMKLDESINIGKDTKNAVIKYQKSNALESDGIVGYNTWKKILGVAK